MDAGSGRVSRYTDEAENKKFQQRELLFLRNDYPAEQRVMEMIREGELEKLDSVFEALSSAEIKVGNMAADNIRLDQYMSVIFIALAEREAIRAGVPEGKAFDEGDRAMLRIDRSGDESEIFRLTAQCIYTLTKWVRELKESRRYSPAVRKCIEYIDVHLHQPIFLEALVRETGFSRVYLSRLFGRELGMSVPQYVNSLRLEEAELLLRTTSDSAATIANLVGFNSQSYFILHFKKKYGITPGEYRKLI